ncbi:DUF7535 family protein [Haloarchaeobius litoreus]|uniref:Uncharacterized protein n=1 Tax=Haloarchaeobius litoreus TaxID=755306 RepID=A0ABD6DCT0_9EURY|nr:hypothetical protein [Haloarchaeobius litoreus]
MSTLSESAGMHPDASMSAIGYIIAALLALVLLPLAPIILVVWITLKIAEAAGGEDEEDARRPGTA